MKIDAKMFWAGVLSTTAVILLAANLMAPPKANAMTTIKDRDYSACTAKLQDGSEGLYVLDNSSGMMGVFNFSTQTKGVALLGVRPAADAFTEAHGGHR